MKIFKNIFKILILIAVFAAAVYFFVGPKLYVTPIIMYHNVEDANLTEPNWVSPKNFEKQLQYIASHGYEVITLDELVNDILQNKGLKSKTVVITFDDGHENIYKNAYPLLKKYQFPAIIFVPPDLVGKEGFLTWEQIDEMRDNGIDIGSHTRSHIYLPDLSYQDQRDQIINSKMIIEQRLNSRINYFAYPIGGFSYQTKRIIKEAGYKGACATNRGYDRFNRDVYNLNRVRFSNKDIRNDYLWIKLSGFYNLLRKNRKPF